MNKSRRILNRFSLFAIAGPEDNVVKVGQDFTRPPGWIDLRWSYRDLSENKESHSITLRAEQPRQLSDRWKLNTHLDIPAVYNSPSSDNRGKWGLGAWTFRLH
ncbi:MAG: hypothetical protein ACU841_07980 [Gammaproteobacteria bacterium]